MLKKFLSILIFFSFFLHASQYAIVINQNSSVSQLNIKQIKDLFLKKRHFMGATQIIPVNITSTFALRKTFENKVLHIQGERLNQYWIKKHFQGISPPLTQSSEKSMKLFIKNVDGAIGYLPISQLDKDLKVLYEF